MDGTKRRSERIYVAFTKQELADLDDWGFSQRIRERASVIRLLALAGLRTATSGCDDGPARQG